MSISVIYKNGAFYARTPNQNRHASMLKKAGWKCNGRDGWFTTNLTSASLLRDFADERAKNIIDRAFIKFTHWNGDALSIPKGLNTLPFQPGAVQYSMCRNRSYLALSPGLGKTIVAALIAALMKVRTVYICPPFLTLNTLEEFQKWAPELHTKILDNVDYIVPDVLIVPDSQLANVYLRDYLRFFKAQLLIGDEWHRFKTDTAQRSRALFGYHDNRKKIKYQPGILDGRDLTKIIAMSGTPVPNGRPIELYPTLRKLAGEYINFMSMQQFGLKYCKAFPIKNDYNGKVYGYDLTGCDEKNFKKLMDVVKSDVLIHKEKRTIVTNNFSGFMLRLNKSILGLPKLTEEVVVLGDEMPRELKSMDVDLGSHYSSKDLIKWEIKRLMGLSDSNEDIHIMTYRRLLGEYKVKPAVEFITSILEETDENLLIVAIHKKVISMLEEKLSDFNPMVITGDTPTMKRQKIVKEYQASKNRRIILGNLDAIGIGFTLTKVNRIPLVEFDWSDGKNRQVIDRAHRHGLKHELLAQYLVFKNSMDRTTIKTLLEKQQRTSHV
jgi:SWI/SNF-related matrix-associated actin-dependent regulator 1 of chromatin subfamily A